MSGWCTLKVKMGVKIIFSHPLPLSMFWPCWHCGSCSWTESRVWASPCCFDVLGLSAPCKKNLELRKQLHYFEYFFLRNQTSGWECGPSSMTQKSDFSLNKEMKRLTNCCISKFTFEDKEKRNVSRLFLQCRLRTWVSSIYKTQVLFEMHPFSFLEDLAKPILDCLLLADFYSCLWNLKAFVWGS